MTATAAKEGTVQSNLPPGERPQAVARVLSPKINKTLKKLSQKSRNQAKELHDAAYIYALYALVDSLAISYSTLKYAADLATSSFFIGKNSLDSAAEMQKFMGTIEGGLIAGVESVFIISLALFAHGWGEDNKNKWKRYIAASWPYIRDTLKGLKNTQKGFRSIIESLSSAGGPNLNLMIAPIGIGFGVLTIINRYLMRKYVIEPRKVMMTANAELLMELQATCRLYIEKAALSLPLLEKDMQKYQNSYILVDKELWYMGPNGVLQLVPIHDFTNFNRLLNKYYSNRKKPLYLSRGLTEDLITKNTGHIPTQIFDEDTCKKFRQRLEQGRQSRTLRNISLVSSAYGGLVDGLYIFMGVMVLAAAAPHPLFLLLLIVSATFCLIYIPTRVYEEHNYQRQLLASAAKIDFFLCEKELERLLVDDYLDLVLESTQVGYDASDFELKRKAFFDRVDKKITKYGDKRKEAHSQAILSYSSAILAGLKNGLVAYGALVSVMFAINALFAVTFPPAVLIMMAATGVACLIGFLTYSLWKNYKERTKVTHCDSEDAYASLKSLYDSLKEKAIEVQNLEAVIEKLPESRPIDPNYVYSDIENVCEVVRAAGTGPKKAQNVTGFFLTEIHLSNAGDGVMAALAASITAFFIGVFATRAWVKANGRSEELKITRSPTDRISSPLPALAIGKRPERPEPPKCSEQSQPSDVVPGNVSPPVIQIVNGDVETQALSDNSASPSPLPPPASPLAVNRVGFFSPTPNASIRSLRVLPVDESEEGDEDDDFNEALLAMNTEVALGVVPELVRHSPLSPRAPSVFDGPTNTFFAGTLARRAASTGAVEAAAPTVLETPLGARTKTMRGVPGSA
jgi:hypothetical protein